MYICDGAFLYIYYNFIGNINNNKYKYINFLNFPKGRVQNGTGKAHARHPPQTILTLH